jgi:hypothetical protein
MNTETGEFKNFGKDEEIKIPWREWSVDELVEIKGGLFQVVGIDVTNHRVTLEGRNKNTRIEIKKLAVKMKGG